MPIRSPNGWSASSTPGTTNTPIRSEPPGLRARAVIRTEYDAACPGGTRLETLRSDPPLTLRQTAPGVVHLVATAAGPLDGDHLGLSIDVAPGTSLSVFSVASTLALPGRSRLTVTARVGPGASLRYSPEPLVLADGCDLRVDVLLSLAGDATAFWREEIVFGRYGEPSGRCRSRFDATVDGVPLLRQEVTAGDPALHGSPAVFASARCAGSTLLVGDLPREVHLAEGCAVLPLAGPGTLVSALAADTVELRRRLEWGERLADKSLP
ncbi:urease accessory protein UreD [Acrocarpospora phusangensis]|uniref:Urease accessory protein UreD n=1 Tax=Acrocarpospora phusangensis TaxID=1070424 RepID=A0A919QI73_9ACTN|nr:urease accessory protein UreD [Acrocarpospora phusangensis]GIH28078.1 urease accessory protein UreD [Acrocarpospora phusangensis]